MDLHCYRSHEAGRRRTTDAWRPTAADDEGVKTRKHSQQSQQSLSQARFSHIAFSALTYILPSVPTVAVCHNCIKSLGVQLSCYK